MRALRALYFIPLHLNRGVMPLQQLSHDEGRSMFDWRHALAGTLRVAVTASPAAGRSAKTTPVATARHQRPPILYMLLHSCEAAHDVVAPRGVRRTGMPLRIKR